MQWLDGLERPAFQENGPYSFQARWWYRPFAPGLTHENLLPLLEETPGMP